MNLHEGCGRIKLFWLMALADANTLKAVVEFKSRTPGEIILYLEIAYESNLAPTFARNV